MTDEELRNYIAELSRYERHNRLDFYEPYEKQKEFHAAGLTHTERLFRAGNQLGKTISGAAEMAYHLTGLYPEWWKGRRWSKPINAWAGGPSGELVRDSVQRYLFGKVGSGEPGMVNPKYIKESVAARGVADLLDYVTVEHFTDGKCDGLSVIKFKNYEQDRNKWQAETLDLVWFDEEPPKEIYSEGVTRLTATRGMAYMTFTPLLGMSEVVRKFLMEPTKTQHDTNMTIYDVKHLSDADRELILSRYQKHEREARAMGRPMLGSGLVFPVDHDAIAIKAFEIPEHWGKLGAMDFGGSGDDGHPTAAVKLAHDRDNDVVYVTHCYAKRGGVITQHAEALKGFGEGLPFVWPHDGLIKDRGSAEQYWQQYKKAGINMMDYRVTFEDGGNGVEAGLMLMLERFETGRLRIFSHLNDLFDELGLYHRKDGVLVKLNDDRISAVRYGIMGLRFAKAKVGKVLLSAEDMLQKQAEFNYGHWTQASGWMGS